MATLEKPKQNKKLKKIKPKKSELICNEDEASENKSGNVLINQIPTSSTRTPPIPNFDNIGDFVASSSASKADILTKESFIASDYKVDDTNCTDKKSNINDETKSSDTIYQKEEKKDCDTTTEASAPPCFDNLQTSALKIPTVVKYPQLQCFQYEEAVDCTNNNSHTTASRLKAPKLQPMTQKELSQYYFCPELLMVQQFEMEFLMNSLLETYEKDPLYGALKEYYCLQRKLTANLHDVKKFRKEAENAREHIWVTVPVSKTFSDKCGDNIEVKEPVTYNIIQVDRRNLEAANSALTALFDLLSNTYISNFIATNISKIKINQMMDDLICDPTKNFEEHLKLQVQLDRNTLTVIAHLRRALSILFRFSRMLSPNKEFDSDLKNWIRKLVSLHLRLATKEDHWFLLFNILRCPSGVGVWASEFLQIPCNKMNKTLKNSNELPLQLNSPEINHCMSVLQILAMPIKKRKEYLKQFTQSQKEVTDPMAGERWILIDSDGEDSHTAFGDCAGLKESDLIALLNQIPFDALFTSALSVEKFLNDYTIEIDLITTSKMLQVTSFFSQLITLFGEAMMTYNNERYKQLAKRFGRLMRHTLQYIFDYYELFKQNKLTKDFSVGERITAEHRSLILKACRYIYNTRNLATWQYFSSLPFSVIDTDTIWEIFYYLNIGFPENSLITEKDYIELLSAPDFWTKFNIANADSSDEDLYYLLQTFFEMANDRNIKTDWELINTIMQHLFNIGFINTQTRDICYKTARDMLVNITLSHEELISCLLAKLKISFHECENIHYLFKSLPLKNWKPDMQSFNAISTWLLHDDFKSDKNMLARLIISNLNWSYDCDGNLFLPHDIHVRMGCLIYDAWTKHSPEVSVASSISESVRQVSSLIDFNQSTKEEFSTWCWTIVSILHLHKMDQNVEQVKLTLADPAVALISVPEVEQIDIIYQGITENRPLAMYMTILVSLHGHSIPLIYQKGFDLIQRLLNDQRYVVVIRCVELIVPLFLDAPDTLANSERFQCILNNLLNADKTFLKMAKDVVYPNTVGPVLELLDNMINHQITSYISYGLSSPLNLINIWLNCLTALPNWQNSYVAFLLDKLLRVAYQFPDANMQCVQIFHNYYKESADWKGINKKSTLKGFFGGNQSKVPTLSSYYPWLALISLEIEFKTQDSYIWNELLRQLSAAGSKPNIDIVLKKTLTLAKKPIYPASMLVLYKYVNLMANMDIKHALFPIISQKFFELYLSRLPVNYNEHGFQQFYGFSDKFYDYNITAMKKIKTQFLAAEAFYKKEATGNTKDLPMYYWCIKCAEIMKTYTLWLEDTAINEMVADQVNCPPQYNNEKLKEILNGNTSHWTEFLYLPALRKEQRSQADQWARICYRLRTNTNLPCALQPKAQTTPLQRIKYNLGSYDSQLPPPQYVKPFRFLQQEITQHSLQEFKEKLSVLTTTAKKFDFKSSELNAINRNFVDNIVHLYVMVPYEVIKIKNCNSLLFTRQCRSPARIKTTLEMIRKNEGIEQKLTLYRERHDEIVEEILNENFNDFSKCVEEIGQILRLLVIKSNEQHDALNQLKSNTGVKLFYLVIENMSDMTMKFSATNQIYTQLLNDLGVFIQENQESEGIKILKLALKRPDLIKPLSSVFVPSQTRPSHFLNMYKFLIESHLKLCDTKILFVLFSKFDLVLWLESYRPKLFDINNLLQLVLQGLESWSQPSSSLLQDQFRRHLVHIYDYDFPEHYGEVMQMVLGRISEQKILPVVMFDLLNSLLIKSNCEQLDLETNQDKLEEISMDFARKQALFNLKATTDTIMLFARHFQKERLNHGLHGLYPKHKDYCQPLSMWFSCFGHSLLVRAICTYQELLADQICDLVFGSVIEMYSPWLIPYTGQTIQQSSANWIRQLVSTVNGNMLHPWSEQHASYSRIIIKNFIRTLIFFLENLPISHKILSHVFSWYIHHFSVPNIECYIYGPIHEGISELPWEFFKPQVEYLDMLYDILQKFIPESHAMLGHIFIRINWNEWFSGILPTIPAIQQTTVVSRLFTIFIKISFEPNIHTQLNTSKILEDAINFPWYMIDYSELENLMKWFVATVEPTIILKIPSETNYVDRAVLELLQLACVTLPERSNQPKNITNATAKRILYTRSMIRLHRTCAAKNPKLLATKEGLSVFRNAFQELLNTLNHSLCTLASAKTHEESRREALNVMLEIILPMQTQSEETSNLHIECMVQWQEDYAQPGNILMCSILNSIGHMKAFIGGTYTLLEATIAFYFRSSQVSSDWHTASWVNLLQLLQMSLEKLELMPIMRDFSMFTLHVFILYKMEKMPTVGDQITFLQDLSQLVEGIKTEPTREPIMAVVWGAMISWGCKIMLREPENGRKPLVMLARHLQFTSTQAEGWGDGILGAIGFKKDVVTNKLKVLTRCLAIVIFSLLHHKSSTGKSVVPTEDYSSSMRELSMLLANKKFVNVKAQIGQCIDILSENNMPELADVSHLVCRLISLFYNDCFLHTVPEVWEINFNIPCSM